MAEINLLQTNKGVTPTQNAYGFLNKLGITVLVLVVIGYAYLFYAHTQVHNQMTSTENQKIQTENEIKQNPNYADLISAQTKIKDVKVLLDNHLAWSKFIQAFSSATLNTATYNKFVAKQDGSASINGTVPDFKNLDKLIKGLSLPDFDFIKEVKLTNVALADNNNQTAIEFNLNVMFNKGLLLWDRNKQ